MWTVTACVLCTASNNDAFTLSLELRCATTDKTAACRSTDPAANQVSVSTRPRLWIESVNGARLPGDKRRRTDGRTDRQRTVMDLFHPPTQRQQQSDGGRHIHWITTRRGGRQLPGVVSLAARQQASNPVNTWHADMMLNMMDNRSE